MNIKAFPSGPFETNAYVVSCPETHECTVVDPAPESFDTLTDYITEKNLIPTKILLTHSHWDHIADVAPLKEKYNIPVLVHRLDAANVENPGSDGLPCWISIKGVHPDKMLEEGDVIPVGNLKWHVIHTPGHTPGGVCFYNKENGVLLSGDTLFRGTIGNISIPTARPDLMWGSLEKLSKLPSETKVYPGHGSSTTIGTESWLPNAKKVFG